MVGELNYTTRTDFFGYNYSETLGDLVDKHKSKEYSCSFDFIGIYE
jgi:hypothetical protein